MVEDIHKKREPLYTMEAVYLITPCEKSVHALINDFSATSRVMYKAAHVFFTEGIDSSFYNQKNKIMWTKWKLIKGIQECLYYREN